MSSVKEIRLPNIGDFSEVEIIEIFVQEGDSIQQDDALISLESDKATIDVPSPAAGRVANLKVSLGDKLSQGDLILTMENSDTKGASDTQKKADNSNAVVETASEARDSINTDMDTEVLVLGSGPGGYTAAFRCADLGKQTLLVEKYPNLGGVCLNVGCIPSKTLLHAAKVISESREMKAFGVDFGEPEINLDKLRGWKDKVLGQLTHGLKGLARQRKVKLVQGTGQFVSSNCLKVDTGEGEKYIGFEHAIIATGSSAAMIPDFPDDPRIIDSTGALKLENIPRRLLVIGGGIIGLEMATVYHALGARVTIVEMLDTLIAGADSDVLKPLQRRIEKQYENIYLGTRVTEIRNAGETLEVSFQGDSAPEKDDFDLVLVAVGRRPNGNGIGAEAAGVAVDDKGFIQVDKQQRTNVPHIHAIGDVVGQPMLAHKAVHEGKVAAEVVAGMKSSFDARVIPSVAYTDPEVAWVGITESMAREQGLNYGKGVFPWAASGRSLSLGRNEGMTKLLCDEDSKQIIGAGIVGTNAGDLIAEVVLAIEMGCDAEDIGLTIHPHPTLSETVAFSAEMFEGTITDLYIPKK